MSKEILCVFQDCVMCGDRGKKLKDFIAKKHLNVRKVSFASPEGRELCYKAVFENGIGVMPFFTDGVKFSTSLEELTKRKPAKKKTTRKKKVEVSNESD